METRANYIMVGCFVLLLVFGLLGFVLWLAKFQFEAEFARYDIVFESTVTGLREGSPVRYRGVRVGEVTSVDLDPDRRSEEHTSELQSLMRSSYAVFCLKKKKPTTTTR